MLPSLHANAEILWLQWSILSLAGLLAFGTPKSKSQQTNAPAGFSADRSEINAYRTLFRHAGLYAKLADEAEESPQPKPHLRAVLTTRYGLSEADSSSLLRVAHDYAAAMMPLEKERRTAIDLYHARFPTHVVQPGSDLTPPPELARVQAEMNATVLLYRDVLRNTMRARDFENFHQKLVAEFSKQLQAPGSAR